MTNKIKSPNEKSNAFIYTLVAVLLIIAAVIGYIIWSGKEKNAAEQAASLQQTNMKVDYRDGVIELAGPTPASDMKTVDLFEDYSCHYCAQLAAETDESMKTQIEAGKLKVRIHSLNFLDKQEGGHSTMAGESAEAIAQAGEAEAYWNYRANLMAQQADIWGKWTLDDFAKSAKAMGASDEVVKTIESGSLKDDYLKAAAASAEELKKMNGGKVSTPQVAMDGKLINTVNEQGNGFGNWPKEVVEGSVKFAPAAE